MTKGKYAAKAKNRLANLDNEILQEVVAERDALKAELNKMTMDLNSVRRDINAQAMHKGAELAAADVNRISSELAEAKEFHASELERIAFEAFKLIFPTEIRTKQIGGNLVYELPDLFGMGNRVGELMSETWGGKHSTRDFSRRNAKWFRMVTAPGVMDSKANPQ